MQNSGSLLKKPVTSYINREVQNAKKHQAIRITQQKEKTGKKEHGKQALQRKS